MDYENKSIFLIFAQAKKYIFQNQVLFRKMCFSVENVGYNHSPGEDAPL